jgi:chromosome segregation protein
MFLYKLEVQGFKSFVDKTQVEFGNGITGIIGPNGCGKTNISDAIRWVLGEQSAKQLRGGTMEDVIFNGSPKRKPLGLAEVHLTFKNDRGILPTEFSEVTVSRRVFRSGMSEYFINKAPCRLRDVRDLFYDTGMGSHAYSVIERSMVDHVLSDSSGHRRFLFEEASGITKYKSRKKEALNKLDATESDLTRLNDIVFELERELRSLARQVGKARRHKRLRDEIKVMDLHLTAGRVETLRRTESEAKEQWQEEVVRREGVTAELGKAEAKLNDQKLALLELERELSTAMGGLRDREDARTKAEHQVVLLKERAAGLLLRADENAAEAVRMRERLTEVGEREREAEQQLAGTRSQREGAVSGASEAETALRQVESELRERRGAAHERKQLSLDLFSIEAEKRGAIERMRERHSSLAERRDQAAERLRELGEKLEALEHQSQEAETRHTALASELDQARSTLGGLDERLRDAADAMRRTEETLAGSRQQSAALESRLATLLELKRSFDGVSEGAKALFSADDRPAGLVGVVADVVEVPSEFLNALEASLGEAAAFVLVDDGDARDACLERLRRIDNGRATLVDLSMIAGGGAADVPVGDGVVGRASDLVRCEDRYRPLVERLLGTVIVVEDRDAAARHAMRSEAGLRFVSLDGEVWERGRVRAGSTQNLGGLLHRETEIRELSGQIAERGLEIEGLEHERRDHEARRETLLLERQEAEADVERRRTALEERVRQSEALAREKTWAESEAEERRTEITTREAEMEALSRALAEAEGELAEHQREVEAARALLAELDSVVHALEARREEAGVNAQASRDTLLRLTQEESDWQSQWARAEQTRRELESGLESRSQEERQAREKIAEIEAEVAGLSSGLTGLLESEGTQRERVVGMQTRLEALKKEVQADDDVARQKRFEQTELGELLHQIEVNRLQARAELDRTFERLTTEYQMDPEAWTPEALPEDFDADDTRKRLEEARTRYRDLGPVNLLAVEEYEKKKERYDFLKQQRLDVENARTQLLEAIEKINVTASQLFSETFGKVQVHFQDIFKTLFEGGDAELRMVGEDPLECEIEIAARPRGKHLQSISLMSGGERALTAIALLFAIYLVKPSPFCLLDEVDAPLDDANVDRFLNLLRRFSDRTQVVVITHNKRTMEFANVLYGVTMQELGVSKLVSVRFDDHSGSPEPEPELAGAVAGDG